ncbi:hypothetical protein G4B88_008526 [Cannabis sativa]|uniref:DUF7477 domain-containing protein n=1 Tax=Cannabis sativa TaxID=3483 RepID=A0A7J6EKX1_CANSA|nr:hypothetical protein G4B88_008526 [Cannabis sativa]
MFYDGEAQEEEEDIYNILLPNVGDLPLTPPSAVQSNFISYFAPDFLKPRHDQYVYRLTNGLCVIGLASTHLAFKEQEGEGGGITAVDFNVASFTPPRASISSESKSIDGTKGSVAFLAPLEAILFDIDGTLCDSDPQHYDAFRLMLQEVYELSTFFLHKDWIMEQWEKNYYISSIVGATNGSSLVVMSEGTPYTEQSYKVSESFPYKRINKKWKEGFHVTSMTTAGNPWGLVM